MSSYQQTDLAGGCYVLTPTENDPDSAGFACEALIDASRGAQNLCQFRARLGCGASPVMDSGSSDVVLFVQSGNGRLEIDGRRFDLSPHTGAHIRPGEAFRLHVVGQESLSVLITFCPGTPEIQHLDAMPEQFDHRFPQRTIIGTEQEKQPTGDRFYQLLVGPQTGSEQVTQFIGAIPRSRAKAHFHLYEEAICVLSGHGRMWTGEHNAPVRAGSIIFLPLRQPHCLECEDEQGMLLAGLFYPAGSPAITYASDDKEQ